jgi:adenylate cyclase
VVHTEDGHAFEHVLGLSCTIGRHPQSTLQLGDREMSKEHAIVEAIGGGYRVRDLGSSNGTFVNGQRIREHVLQDGDEVRLGATRIVFRTRSVTAAAARPAGPSPQTGLRRGGFSVLEPGSNMFSSVIASVPGEEATQFRPAAAIQGLDALRADYEKLRAALEFHRQVGAETDTEGVLEKTLSTSFEMLKADNGAILLRDAQGNLSIARVRRRQLGAGVPEEQVVVSATLIKRVIDSREGVLTADAVMDERFVASKSIVAQGIRSALAVPLIAKNEVLGVLFLDTRERTGAFTDRDLRVASAIGSQSAAVLEAAELRRRLHDQERQRDNLARFLPPVLVDRVTQGQLQLQDAGELRQVTVLFSDIRGFTSFAENSEPREVVSMLKDYFELMAEVVFNHRGIVDKFIGDAVMALWGAPEALDDGPLRACHAALEMQAKLAAFNVQRRAEGRPEIGVGFGINSGLAVVGVMGSSRRPEYTAIGDTVNVASRLCGLAEPGQVLVSGDTARLVRTEGSGLGFDALPDAKVRGRQKHVSVLQIVDRRGEAVTQAGDPTAAGAAD